MNLIRIIPRLDIKGPNVVKGLCFDGYRVLGHPETFAELYYKEGADELFFQDTVASLYGRNNLSEVVKKTAKQISIPLIVGGGFGHLDHLDKLDKSISGILIGSALHYKKVDINSIKKNTHNW